MELDQDPIHLPFMGGGSKWATAHLKNTPSACQDHRQALRFSRSSNLHGLQPRHCAGTLADSGVVLQECLDEEALGQIASLSHRIITSLVLYLLRDPVQAHSLITKQEAFSIRELTLEGKHVIEASCGLENFEILESEMPL